MWLAEQVVPSIVDTGQYSIVQPKTTSTQLIAMIANELVELEKRLVNVESAQVASVNQTMELIDAKYAPKLERLEKLELDRIERETLYDTATYLAQFQHTSLSTKDQTTLAWEVQKFSERHGLIMRKGELYSLRRNSGYTKQAFDAVYRAMYQSTH